MWASIAIVMIGAAIFYFEFRLLKKNKRKKREIWYVAIILVPSTIAAVIESRGYQLINPLDYIEAIYSTTLSWIGL
ncbi:hypothetical protein MUN89_03980 [Halobacillus salinarum]|uniref:Lycopene cyclase domain-containing protein n=1 Tax=Halobacillus salinarum TaxID=2932257 RepID=A0ABY4ELS6_9BACI|nr:hypothetical protein [Halobacillus salinarum]UOQ45124.1 hypothetical protein MUN89_03980 [Halobacillus salinarum]